MGRDGLPGESRAAPSGGVPCCRGTLIVGARLAVEHLWGPDGLDEMRRRLGDDVRQALCDDILLPVGWYPEEHLESWCDAVWHGLAQRDEAAYHAFIHRSVDGMWGRVHRVLLRLATPGLLARRAPDIWRHDHTHGQVEVRIGDREGTLRVVGYPLRSEIMRRGQTESLRYILSHARVSQVSATHAVDDTGALVVSFAWS